MKHNNVNVNKVEVQARCPKDGTHEVEIVDSEVDRVTGDELLVFTCKTCKHDFGIKISVREDGLIILTEEK